MTLVVSNSWLQKGILGLVILVLLTPVFGWAAGAVNYAEPLENAAEAAGATTAATTMHPGLFPDYSVSGLDSSLGTLVSGIVGTALTLLIVVGGGRFLES